MPGSCCHAAPPRPEQAARAHSAARCRGLAPFEQQVDAALAVEGLAARHKLNAVKVEVPAVGDVGVALQRDGARPIGRLDDDGSHGAAPLGLPVRGRCGAVKQAGEAAQAVGDCPAELLLLATGAQPVNRLL